MTVGMVGDLDSGEVLDRVRRRLPADATIAHVAAASLDALTPERWTIEWHLPWWLSACFGLPRADAIALVESNVLGLLAVRLMDDLEDGDVPPGDRQPAAALAEAALDAALDAYRARFDAGSPFWGYLDRTMATWRAASDGARPADRAAPVKIAAFACCLLADRIDGFADIEQCLDKAMTALVLYDQFCDWEADLAAGRHNEFVAHVLGRRGPGASTERDRGAVLAAMLTRPVITERFERASGEARAAAALADGLGLDDLARYLRAWAGSTAAQGESIAAHYRRAADRAARLMFQNVPVPTS